MTNLVRGMLCLVEIAIFLMTVFVGLLEAVSRFGASFISDRVLGDSDMFVCDVVTYNL